MFERVVGALWLKYTTGNKARLEGAAGSLKRSKIPGFSYALRKILSKRDSTQEIRGMLRDVGEGKQHSAENATAPVEGGLCPGAIRDREKGTGSFEVGASQPASQKLGD